MNGWVLYATIWFIVWVVCLFFVWRMVDRRDLNRALWIILAIFFPLIILIVVAVLPARQRTEPPEMMQ
jgi:cell division protein FtsW (lipid II flippase)